MAHAPGGQLWQTGIGKYEKNIVSKVCLWSARTCFPRRRRQNKTVPVAVVRERESHRVETRAHGMRSKHMGIDFGSYVINSFVGDMAAVGYKRLVLKSDQGNAMKALKPQAKRMWGAEVIPQHSPHGQSAANGVVEKAIQDVETHIRTTVLALESRNTVRLQIGAPIVFWMIEYAAELLNIIKEARQGQQYCVREEVREARPPVPGRVRRGDQLHGTWQLSP